MILTRLHHFANLSRVRNTAGKRRASGAGLNPRCQALTTLTFTTLKQETNGAAAAMSARSRLTNVRLEFNSRRCYLLLLPKTSVL